MKLIPIYIGTYTTGKSKGIYQLFLNTEQKTLTDVSVAATINNPTYLALSQTKTHLYSVAKVNGQGGIAAFSIHEDGSLALLDTDVSEGTNPCHISIDSSSLQLFTGNYHKGTVEAYLLNEKGSIETQSSSIKHENNKGQQPHVHYTRLSPDENHLCVVDLGLDALITYEAKRGHLSKKHIFSTPAGSGPRHLAFHENGRIAYLLTELSSEVIVLSYNPENGQFTELETISALPKGFNGESAGGAIKLSPNNEFLYVSNRGHESIATFRINQDTGKLTFVSHTDVEGEHPRDFEIDPTGQFLLVANKNTNNLVLFEINKQTGELLKTGEHLTIPEPVCVLFRKETVSS